VVEAVDNQPWSGEANVHVSIANWIKSQSPDVTPKTKRLWFEVEPEPVSKGGKAKGAKTFDLSFRDCSHINSALTDKTDVSGALEIACNVSPQRVFQGVTPGHAGFVLSPEEMELLTKKDPKSKAVIYPYLIGREVASGDGSPQRFIIDFGERSIVQAMGFPAAFERIKSTVLPDVEKKAKDEDESENVRKQHLERWWMHWRHRSDMKKAIQLLKGRYITASRTQRWPFVFSFMASTILPGDKMQVFAFDDDYSFGIIQSAPHLAWYQAKAARLKHEEDYNYSAESVFDTFPWPQAPTSAQIKAVAKAAREIRDVRAQALPGIKDGLRGLYKTLEMPGKNPLKDAHETLDTAVLAAYGFSARRDLLAQLLKLNEAVSTPIKSGKVATPPGIPPGYKDRKALLTSDCNG
jgi:hypothetical protein